MVLKDGKDSPNPKPPYLKAPNGYVYPYSDAMYARGDMVPCHTIPDAQIPKEKRVQTKTSTPQEDAGHDNVPQTEPPASDPGDEEILEDSPKETAAEILSKGNKEKDESEVQKPIKHMNMNELLVYAKKEFGIDLDPQRGLKSVRNELLELEKAAEEVETAANKENTA